MQFVVDTHTAAVQRVNASAPPQAKPKPRPPWTPSVPTLEPWHSVYLALNSAGQQRWDAMSPARRRLAFGVP